MMLLKDQQIEQLTALIPGEVIAIGVSVDDYMERYAADFCEWLGGVVIKMSPIHLRHADLTAYLQRFFETYFELRPIGKVIEAPFVMRQPDPLPKREPDLQILLKTNLHRLKPTYVEDHADICIEVVSPGSEDVDYGAKFKEYQTSGVPEYWIFDPIRKESRLFRLNDDGIYISQPIDHEGHYRTDMLPGLALHVPTLWQEDLPGPGAVVRAVEAMLNL